MSKNETLLQAKIKDDSNRLVSYDLLRIIACFAVIVLHVAAKNWYDQPPASYQWQVFNFYDSVMRFCVPVMIMISGTFFLNPDKEISIKKLLFKYILRLLAAYIFWSLLYAIKLFVDTGAALNWSGIKSIVLNIIYSRYHLWFLPMLIGLYLITPVVRLMTKDENSWQIRYFLILFFIFGLFRPTILAFDLPYYAHITHLVKTIPVELAGGYVGYFVWGYYLFRNEITKKVTMIIYILGILSIISCILVSSYFSIRAGEPKGTLYAYLTVTTFFVSSAIFLFFKYIVSQWLWPVRLKKIIYSVSVSTFGVYLIHDFFLQIFGSWGLDSLTFNSILSVPIIALATFVVSFVVVLVIRKIPFINKYMT